MDDLLSRFNDTQKEVIQKFFIKLAVSTNKSGKMAESRKIKIIRSWEKYAAEAVISAPEVYMKMDIPRGERGKGKNERYVLGIIRNKAGEASAGKMAEGHGRPDRADEGMRLGALIREHKLSDGDTDCDF